jgi:hypothetical protein
MLIGWVLMQKLADKLNIPVIEVYRRHIKDLNVYQDIEINSKATSTIMHSWGLNGIGWVAEKVDSKDNIDIVRLWYGSSSYNSSKMAKLIDNIVQDCKLQDIETMTEEQLKNMCESWRSSQERSIEIIVKSILQKEKKCWDLKIKKMAQKRFEELYSREEFMQISSRNYLD